MCRSIQIRNGTVYDPKNGIDGEEMDIFIADGKLVEEASPKPEVVIDARGKAVVPGGIDVHSHVATYGLNLTRFTFGFPTLGQIGDIYARMGYTHVNEPLMTLNTASYVHHELSGIPIVDTSAFLVLTLHDIEKGLREGDREGVKRLILHLLGITKALNAKLYDVEVRYEKRGFFYRDIPIHRCLNFFHELSPLRDGMPGIQLRTYPELLEEDTKFLTAFCLADIASGIDNEERYEAALAVLKRGGCVDLGITIPVLEGMGNMRIGYENEAASSSSNFISMDIGLEKPLIYSRIENKSKSETDSNNVDKRVYYSLSFALDALKYYKNISFSTDSSNGCSFYAYPGIFAALLSHDNRTELVKEELPHDEYSMYELVAITRENPARQLGLGDNKGHLGTGADADIAIYDIGEDTEIKDLEKRLRSCLYLLKGGEVVIREGELINGGVKKRTLFLPERGEEEKEASEDELTAEVLSRRSFRAEHLNVDDCFLSFHTYHE